MIDLAVFKSTITPEERAAAQSMVDNCSEGFDIQAHQICQTRLISAYVDFLADDKGNDIKATSVAVTTAVNSMIEKHNIGAKQLVDTARRLVLDKFKGSDIRQTLLSNLVSDFNDIDTRYTTSNVRTALESMHHNQVSLTRDALCIGEIYFDKYINKYLPSFSEEFASAITE